MLAQNSTKTLTGAKVVIETLKNLGVDTIFGYPGGVVLNLYDELYKDKSIKHILVRHEQAAVHAAEGYARASGKCGVVLVTSGPGATNTITGIVNAYLDGYPVVVLTGQVLKDLIGKNAFQEADICGMVKSCTKRVFQITNANEINKTLTEAFTLATSGKKGPVVVDMAKDIFSQSVEFCPQKIKSSKLKFDSNETDRILDKILKSSYPVIVAGGGIVHSGAEGELYNFAKTLKIPVVSTMMGLGSYPQDDENYFGMIGIFGDKSANEILKQSDLIFSLGARFNDRISCMFSDSDLNGKIIQIDINEDEVAKFIKPKNFIIADAKDILIEMNKSLSLGQFKDWLYYAQGLKKLNTQPEKRTNLLHSFEVIQKIEDFTKDQNIIFTSEVGQHQLFAVKNLKFKSGRKILVSGGSGTMGFGLPAGIGASIASDTNPVVCISGDGSFQMNLNELATCVDYNLNLKIFIINNGYLGMVRQLQEKSCNGRYSQTKISNPDFVKLAQSYGMNALRVTNIQDVDKALTKAFDNNQPFLIDFVVEPMEVV
ncbi:biosynthetic-type acetolactate synthase large subunit [bacterium]|nr:biosynthetic-type acetolactate synthase large subunit [bacterium]